MVELSGYAMSDAARALAFYAIALALSALVLGLSSWLGEASPLVTMLTPALALLAMMAVTGEGGSRQAWRSLGFHRAAWAYWPIAAGLPAAVLVAAYGLTWATGLGHLAVPEMPGGYPQVAARLGLGFCFGLVLAMGEEIGWRGYMLPRLLAAAGVLPAMLVVGFLHGVWHMPLLLGTPYYHSAGNPVVVVPMFLATLTLAGVVFGWLRLASESVWPVAIAHAAWNFVWGILAEMTKGAPDTLEYVAGESGILPLAGLAIVAALLVRRMPKRLAAQPVA